MKKMRKVWITLFDYVEDDEYDGDLVEHDDESPRVLLQYKLTNEATSVTERKAKERESQIKETRDSQVLKTTTTTTKVTTTTTKHNF